MTIFKSASKIVFILMALATVAALFVGKITGEQFLVLARGQGGLELVQGLGGQVLVGRGGLQFRLGPVQVLGQDRVIHMEGRGI